MKTFREMKARPWPATALVACIVAALLLFIPVAYTRTIGQDATLIIQAPSLGMDQLQKIGSEFRSALHATSISFNTEDRSSTVEARVTARSRAQVERVAQAFAKGLADRGIPALARVTPRTERVLGNVYAYARDNVVDIHISTAGKSPRQVEDEIRTQLEAAGIENPTVEYSKDGDKTTLKVEAHRTAGEESASAEPQVRLSLDGHAPGEAGTQAKTCDVRVRRTPGMTDQQVLDDVQRQLREQGFNGYATFEDGKLQIHAGDAPEGARQGESGGTFQSGAGAGDLVVSPNPFADRTGISFRLSEPRTGASVGVFDVQGRQVRGLFSGPLSAGSHQFQWDGLDSSGRPAREGTYFVRVQAPGMEMRTKLVRTSGR